MALPVIPVALAAGALAVARNIHVLPVDQRRDDLLDDLPEGGALGRNGETGDVNGAYRYRRIVRFGKNGPGIEVDASFLGRIKVSRLD